MLLNDKAHTVTLLISPRLRILKIWVLVSSRLETHLDSYLDNKACEVCADGLHFSPNFKWAKILEMVLVLNCLVLNLNLGALYDGMMLQLTRKLKIIRQMTIYEAKQDKTGR